MTDPTQNPSTAPIPNPEGIYTFSPKVLGQSSTVRQELSRFATENVGIQIFVDDTYADPDTGSLSVEVYYRTDFQDINPYGVPTDLTDHIVKEDVGVYSFKLPTSLTSNLGLLTIHWQYKVIGEPYDYWDYYQVIEPMPIYDTLSDGERGIVKMVSMMFGDLYDSVDGGPHLKEEFQTHYGTETLALCLQLAANRINISSQPWTNYVIGDNNPGGSRFPANGYPILMMATYLEVVRHLIRSYTEQPNILGGPGVAYTDRRDYVDRWRNILNDEKEDYDNAIRNFKRSIMSLGGGNLIVSGGIFGTAYGRYPGSLWNMANRAGRFYPMTFISRY